MRSLGDGPRKRCTVYPVEYVDVFIFHRAGKARCGELRFRFQRIRAPWNSMHYVYVLRSKRDGKSYVGYTSDLQNRVKLHNAGRVLSTRERRPLEVVYYEACLVRGDALKREKYLKTAYGKRYIKNRLREHLNGLQ